MTIPTRPTSVLLIHDGNSVDEYLTFLQDAGLQAREAHASLAVAQAVEVRPDIIVLDFDCDGEVTGALQGDIRTRHIPVIALAHLSVLGKRNV